MVSFSIHWNCNANLNYLWFWWQTVLATFCIEYWNVNLLKYQCCAANNGLYAKRGLRRTDVRWILLYLYRESDRRLLQTLCVSKVSWKNNTLLEVEFGTCSPVPHSWQRQCYSVRLTYLLTHRESCFIPEFRAGHQRRFFAVLSRWWAYLSDERKDFFRAITWSLTDSLINQ